jgi:hypothetical protein
MEEFVKGYVERKKISTEEFYVRLIGRMLKLAETSFNLHLYGYMNNTHNLNLKFSNRNQIGYFFSKYRDAVLMDIQMPDHKNFLLALSYKNEGILKSINYEPASSDEYTVDELFAKSLELYQNISSSYLEQSTTVIANSDTDLFLVPRKFLFIYPDLRYGFHPSEPRTFYFHYFSDVFMEYLLDNQQMSILYPGKAELDFLTNWLESFKSKTWASVGFISSPVRKEVFEKLEKELSGRENIDKVDLNLLYLYLGEMASKNHDSEAMSKYYKKINTDVLLNNFRTKEFANQINNHALRLLATAVEGLASVGDFDEVFRLLKPFKKNINRSSVYAFAAKELIYKKSNQDIPKRLLDSARVELVRAGSLTANGPHKIQIAYANTLLNPKDNLKDSFKIIKNLPRKDIANGFIVRSLSYHGKLYEARKNFPENLSYSDNAYLLGESILGYARNNGTVNKEWTKFQSNYSWGVLKWIFYIDESS